jgi:hypothetical protein
MPVQTATYYRLMAGAQVTNSNPDLIRPDAFANTQLTPLGERQQPVSCPAARRFTVPEQVLRHDHPVSTSSNRS